MPQSRRYKINNVPDNLQDALLNNGVEIRDVSTIERQYANERWLLTFASNVRKMHGVSIYLGFRWHGFSYKIEPRLEGAAASEEYLLQWPAPYYVFYRLLGFSLT